MRAAKSLPTTIFITLLMGMLSCGAAMAAGADDLYRTRTTVTGQGETNRLVGFAICLEQVLIKVSGAIRLEGDARLASYKAKARDFVRSYDTVTRSSASRRATSRARATDPTISPLNSTQRASTR